MFDPDELQRKLKALNDAYAVQLPEKLHQIVSAWEGLPRDRWDQEGFETLHRLVHSLTGSGKTFGFALLSNVARSLEERLKEMLHARLLLNDDQRNQVQVYLSELQQVSRFRDESDIAGLKNIARIKRCQVDNQKIFLVDDDNTLSVSLQAQLNYFGYDVSAFSTLTAFQTALQDNPEVVVIMDISFPDDILGGIRFMKEFQQNRAIPLPVIFITDQQEFSIRLEAAKAGCIAYLSKPLNLGILIDKLDALTSALPPEQYRILIVDDSEALTSYYASVLEYSGMAVMTINNPLKIMEALAEFIPDLILLDIYMPECNGMDLAKVIRQLDDFISIPIVYLSAEGNLEKQLYAMGLGGDDFLTKPIQPQHLISSVSSRVRRSLILRSLMARDSLTGLLNHTAIKDQLDREVVRSQRQGTNLCFAMIDIDNFKQVNDTYGHPVGDRVIKSLSRQLKQRLRGTDMIGRYGGEEFAVVLPDTGGEAALQVLDDIRRDFSCLLHTANGQEFSTTFSCGIAEVTYYPDPTKLCDAADMALYKAKHAGRNQVLLAHVKPN